MLREQAAKREEHERELERVRKEQAEAVKRRDQMEMASRPREVERSSSETEEMQRIKAERMAQKREQ